MRIQGRQRGFPRSPGIVVVGCILRGRRRRHVLGASRRFDGWAHSARKANERGADGGGCPPAMMDRRPWGVRRPRWSERHTRQERGHGAGSVGYGPARARVCRRSRRTSTKNLFRGCGNARVLREVLFNYEVSRQHVAFECVRSEVHCSQLSTCTVSPLSDPEGCQDR